MFLDKYVCGEKDDLSVQEIVHCKTQDEFGGRLHRFINIFQNFGMSVDQSRYITTILGELGNNVFDHNWGNWSSDFTGCIILAQRYGGLHQKIQIIVADFGSGFLTSLHPAYPELNDDLSAIEKGLSGFTGRIGEQRGNGLKMIQNWTIDKFCGKLSIHSGEGLINVDASGIHKKNISKKIRGTIAQIILENNIGL
ncbi:MAG: hypothetical protein EOM19_06225 [Candidatus Moranbacteria bacterium]|nr:hypothetical protein [Candidatus Moranbacteria bacterium]